MSHLQVIATSVEDCIVAQANGADSIELCAALELGGLTPSHGLMRMARAACTLPIHAMLRPRPGGAAYTEDEFATMLCDAEALRAAGCNGLVFACSTRTGAIDEQRCALLRGGNEGPLCTFHRAFDLLHDPQRALAVLSDLGFHGILTSGQAATALEGAATIRDWSALALGRIGIMAGGGITPANLGAVVAATGCNRIHGSFSSYVADEALAARPGYRFGAQAERIRILDGAQVRAARAALDAPGIAP